MIHGRVFNKPPLALLIIKTHYLTCGKSQSNFFILAESNLIPIVYTVPETRKGRSNKDWGNLPCFSNSPPFNHNNMCYAMPWQQQTNVSDDHFQPCLFDDHFPLQIDLHGGVSEQSARTFSHTHNLLRMLLRVCRTLETGLLLPSRFHTLVKISSWNWVRAYWFTTVHLSFNIALEQLSSLLNRTPCLRLNNCLNALDITFLGWLWGVLCSSWMFSSIKFQYLLYKIRVVHMHYCFCQCHQQDQGNWKMAIYWSKMYWYETMSFTHWSTR